MTIKLPFLNRVSLKERAFFARQLSIMLSSGITLVQSLQSFAAQTKNHYFKGVLAKVSSNVEEGVSLSEAARFYPRFFSPLFVNVVHSGETSGKLDIVLTDLADELEQESDFSSAVKRALVYPIFIIIVMIAIAFIMMIKVIPALSSVFAESGARLPLSTRILLSISGFVQNYWWTLLIFVVLLVILARYLMTTPEGRLFIDRLLLLDPFGLNKNVYMTRFARTLSLLVSAGVPIVESVQTAAQVVGNLVYQKSLRRVADELERGIPLSSALEKETHFPPLVSQMAGVGEQTGKLDLTLAKLADYFSNETRGKIAVLTSLLEPVIIVIIGVGVAFMVFSVLMPIYNLAQIQ